MGRLIDEGLIDYIYVNGGYYADKDEVDEIPTVEAIPKADYENRLKADMVAILEDLDLQIDESAAYSLEVAKVQRLIRDRINALRGNEDDNC